MSSLVNAVRGLSTRVARGGYKSCLLVSLNDSGTIITRHPMDTELNEYYRVLKDIVLPDCMDLAPDIKGYGDHVHRFLSYTNPAFHDCWNIGVELMYRFCAPQEHQTDENLTKMRILRAALDLVFTMTAVLDDIADNSDTRMNQPAWHKVCDGGVPAAMLDGAILSFMPLHILQRRFKGSPQYVHLLEVFMNGITRTLIGELEDVLSQGGKEVSPEKHTGILNYKAGYFVSTQGPVGLLCAGIQEQGIITQVHAIFRRFGIMLQLWDDFNDYYSSASVTGKPPCDFQNAGTTWVTANAIRRFNPQQLKIFKECYGSMDEQKIERVKQLYEEVDIPGVYVSEMRDNYREIAALISQIPNAKIRQACTSYLDWLIGDVAE